MRRGTLLMLAGAGLFALALLLLLPGLAAATNDPPGTGGTVTGTWTVTGASTYTSVSITVNAGDIIIQNGATLTLNGVTLRVNPGSDGGNNIDVQAGGTLKVQGGSISGAPHYKFLISGTASINGTAISEVWGDNASWSGGVQIFSSQVAISNSSIINGRTGGVSIFNCSPTLYNVTIRFNGQDGASTKYCYGVYGIGTAANISMCNITENSYAIWKEYNVNPQKYPPDGSGTYWGGKWWYGSTGYYYRYEYSYRNTQGDLYGIGVFMEGGSTASLYNNTISRNGWAPGGYYGYSYSNPDASHYEYIYYYQYCGHKCFGIGVWSKDSSLNIEANKIENNGFDPTGYLQLPNYVCYYWGNDIKMEKSYGNISFNYIANSTALINNSLSSPNITSNKLFCEYGKSSTWSYMGTCAIIPDGTGYGIRNEKSSPVIYNNTIKQTVADALLPVGGYPYCMKYMIGIEVYACNGLKMESNKVTMENRISGQVQAIGINITMKSTGIKVLNSSLDYKFTPEANFYSIQTPGTEPAKDLVVTMRSEALIDNTTLKANAGQGGNYYCKPPPVTCFVVCFGSSAEMGNSTVSMAEYGVLVSDFSKLTLVKTNITACSKYCMAVDTGATAVLRSVIITSTVRGLQITKGTVSVYDSTLYNPTEFFMDSGAVVNVFNSSFQRSGVMIRDVYSSLNVSWYLDVNIHWQDGSPAVGVGAKVFDALGSVVTERSSDEAGSLGATMVTREFNARSTGVVRYTPHRIVMQKGRISDFALVILNASQTADILLVDSLGPDVSIDFPSDGSLVNRSSVNIRGAAVDVESGLTALEMSIDGRDWWGMQTNPGTFEWNRTVSFSEGPHLIKVRGTDRLGNVFMASSSVNIDTGAPLLTLISPANGAFFNVRTIEVRGISEPGALVAVNGKAMVLDGRFFTTYVSLVEGQNTISATASDAVGNTRTVSIEVIYDADAPRITMQSPRDRLVTNQNPISVEGDTDIDAVSLTVNGIGIPISSAGHFETSASLFEGSNSISIVARDRAGNSNSVLLVVTLDTVPPALSLTNPRDGLYSSLYRIQIAGSAESDATVTVNGENTPLVNNMFTDFMMLSEGPNKLTVVATDPAGNRNSTSRTVYRDTRPPDISVTYPAEGAILSNRIVEVMGSVDWGASVTLNGVPVPVTDFVFSTTVRYEADGKQTIELTAKDPAGNGVVVTRSIVIDTSPPSVEINAPSEGFKTKGRYIMVEGITEPGATVVINTETVTLAGADGRFSAQITLEDGKNRVTVKATDKAGFSATAAVEITKTVPPAVVKSDNTWMMTMSGILMGLGLIFPIIAGVAATRSRRHRRDVLSSLEPPPSPELPRPRMPESRIPTASAELVQPVPPLLNAPQDLPPPPPPEYYTNSQMTPHSPQTPPPPELTDQMTPVPFSGLQAKNTELEVNAGDIDSSMKRRAISPHAYGHAPAQAPPVQQTGLRDKRVEAEYGAGEIEQNPALRGRPRQ